MTQEFVVALPDIGEGVVEGEVIEWRKQVGELVVKDEPVVVVMTDKATVELPSPHAGKLSRQFKAVGEIAVRDQPLYALEITVTEPIAPKKTEAHVQQPTASIPQKTPCPLKSYIEKKGAKAAAAPPVRKLAKEMHLDIQQVEGTGKEGRVTEEDLLNFQQRYYKAPVAAGTSSGRAAPPISSSTPVLHLEDDETQPMTGLRHIIAEKMVESKYIVPHFSFFDQADATHLVTLRESIREEAGKYGFTVSFMPFFIKALSETLLKFPQVNGSVDLVEKTLLIHKHHNIGVAARGPNGLLVFTIKNVQNLSLYEVVKIYEELLVKAKEGKLERADLTESTITISNFGPLGGLWATPIINYPEVAILGLAKIRKEPIVKDDAILIRQMVNLSWSFDHRVIDGELAAQVSNTFIQLLENPTQLAKSQISANDSP